MIKELKYYIMLPPTYGKIVEVYLEKLKVNEVYTAYSLDNDLNIVEGIGCIKNNGSYNYHNNYDDSENELYFDDKKYKIPSTNQWFTLNKEVVKNIQKENIIEYMKLLEKELSRVKELVNESSIN